jgi:amino acid adenylation domain-containing protein
VEEIVSSIPARLEQLARQQPTQLAVRTRRQEVTYEALDRAATRLAGALVQADAPEGEPVAFLLEHGASQIVAMFGILKAGAVFVPLDASFPAARTAAMLADSQAGIIVTDNANLALAQQFAGPCRRLVNLDALGEVRGTGRQPGPDTPAYIMYTSGSAGQPKGVVHSHRNVLLYTRRYRDWLEIAPGRRHSLLGSCSFAAALTDIFSTLLNGATLLPFDVKANGVTQLARWLAEDEVTVYHSVPTVFRQFVATLTGAERFPKLRLVWLGGETVLWQDVELYQKHFGPDCRMTVGFAATEVPGIGQYFLDKDSRPSGTRVPVAYAADCADLLLLDEAGNAVGPGEAGEIALKSPQMALGYWRQPELTRTAFPPLPGSAGARLYRTGDLGRMRPEGCLEHLGRKDWQLKIRGHRVDAAEVENALLTVPGIKEAVVAGRDDGTGNQRLVAYIVPVVAPGPTVTVLRRALRGRLPEPFIPSAFVRLASLPLTATGKVDRQSLPTPENKRPDLDSQYFPPEDPLTVHLVAAWEQCLNVRPVGILDDFFELGGDSLKVVEMLVEVEKRTGKRLPPDVLMSGATVRQLVDAFLAMEGGRAQPSIQQVQAGDSRRPPFFYLHGNWYGGGLYCNDLARHLGADQPLLAIQPHGLTTRPVPWTVEEMADDLVADLLAYQPAGPYLLAGYCVSGLIALEMAHRLRALGHRVDLLVVIAPLRKVQLQGNMSWMNAPVVSPQARLPRVDLRDVKPDRRRGVLQKIYMAVHQNYRLRPYPGRLELLLPIEEGGMLGPANPWRSSAAQVNIQVVPGGHYTSLTSHVQDLARCLRACIDRAVSGV